MEFHLEPRFGQYHITHYGPDKIRVNEVDYISSLLITNDKLITDWAPQTILDLKADHLIPLIALSPSIIILGTGNTQQFPSHTVLAPCYEKLIGVEIMDTGAACRTFCALIAEGRHVMAALLK